MSYEALIEKRNEVAARLRELTSQLTHIDAVIPLFQPGYTPRKRGATARAIFDLLRTAKAPMTTAKIAEAIGAEARGVGSALHYQQAKGAVRSERRGKESVWAIS